MSRQPAGWLNDPGRTWTLTYVSQNRDAQHTPGKVILSKITSISSQLNNVRSAQAPKTPHAGWQQVGTEFAGVSPATNAPVDRSRAGRRVRRRRLNATGAPAPSRIQVGCENPALARVQSRLPA